MQGIKGLQNAVSWIGMDRKVEPPAGGSTWRLLPGQHQFQVTVPTAVVNRLGDPVIQPPATRLGLVSADV
jgi:hypothetical protein